MKTVLILGAGATRAARPKAALAARAPLDGDFFAIASRCEKALAKRVTGCLEDLVGDYAESLCDSLETATSYLYIKAMDEGTGSAYHNAFLDLLLLLSRVLAQTTNSIPDGPRSLLYRLFLRELATVSAPQDLTIMTFNYDLLAERTLDSMERNGHPGVFHFPGCYRIDELADTLSVKGKPVFDSDSFNHEGVSVLKLHGSMNWQSTHKSDKPSAQAVLNSKRKLHVLDSPEVPNKLSWLRKTRKVHMKPIIIPPVSGKRGVMHESVQPLWNKAGAALREADRVVVSGYSCPPLDLESRILLSENMRANENKKVYVINPDASSSVKFLELCGVDHLTVYTGIQEWIRDARR